jgi:hypothetical protein
MARAQHHESDILERGNIYFVYRPKVEHEQGQVHGIEDVQRSYMILSPRGQDLLRLILLGRKKLPAALQRSPARMKRWAKCCWYWA